jgi:hypothetical protein
MTDAHRPSERVNIEQLGEELASKLIRIMNLRGIDPEHWQAELDRMMVELGCRRIDGVWYRQEDLS